MSPTYAIAGEISSNTFVNGAVHCRGCRRSKHGGIRNTFLGFDVGTEEFLVIKLPKSLMAVSPMDLSIMKYEESSVAVLKRGWDSGQQLDMWFVKEYGVVGSWTKVLHLSQSGSGILPRVLGFRNGKVLLQLDGIEMVSLDLNCQQMKQLRIKAEDSFVDSYVESLVLLDKGLSFVGSSSVNYVNHSSDSDSSE